jgi:pyruvate dehydrogenase E2 component (dihydrolipoamide acetyltransferase)
MVTAFEFPDVGEGVTEGKLIAWLVDEGDQVEEDESLAEVETDKAVVEVPSPENATVLKLHAEEGNTIKVGDVIVTLGEEGEEPASGAATSAEEPAGEDEEDEEDEEEESGSTSVVGELDTPEDTEQESVTVEDEHGEEAELEVEESPESGNVLAAPSVRKLARETDIDITQVNGSGPGGRITREDVLQAAEDGGGEERSTAGSGDQVLATPATRKLAEENGVDIATIDGSGPDGRVTREDVLAAAEGGQESTEPEEPETPETAGADVGVAGGLGTPNRFPPKEYDFEKYGEVEREEMSSTRTAIAKNMERSKYTAPHVTSTDDADVTDLWEVREKEKEVAASRDVHLTFLPFIVNACIAALRQFPRMNASLDETTGEIVKKDYYNIGIAVATDDGLMVPNIKNADEKSILQIAKEMNELAENARTHDLALDEMRGGTFTITNYGSIGGRYGTPILNYPEVAILGTGTIQDEPVVRNGEVVVRKMLPLSVTFDHRVVDGAYVARFMNELIKHLEDPDLLLLDE